MKTKGKKLLALLAVFVLTFSYTGCKKYPDGPAFSLKSKTGRLTGTWKIVESNGEIPSDYDIYLIFEKNNDFKEKVEYDGGSYTVNGSWSWGDKKESVIIEVDDYNRPQIKSVTGSDNEQEFEILRLTNKEFWFKDDDDEYKAEKQ